ncbi:dynamin family protein [Periconia macrospinosa]|uniref:Dynamin family protein n=1 Tax=Periconia macrospinosa TaxID=97972 RepID=A0A2V1D065_9PLEO|nr:dynamin family protein [Periconia macrospinosa]
MNTDFAASKRTRGHSYIIDRIKDAQKDNIDLDIPVPPTQHEPVHLSRSQTLSWVGKIIVRNRGKELSGNFNPLVVGEMFWQQSERWPELAANHVEDITEVCRVFLEHLMDELCPKDIISRLWTFHFEENLKTRNETASKELDQIIEDHRGHPINYNHYYTDIVKKCRLERERGLLATALEDTTTHSHLPGCNSNHTSAEINVDTVIDTFARGSEADMEVHSSEEALDRLHAIYKVAQKTFIVNITIQVVERHLIRGLEDIFSPILVDRLTDTEAENLASEPESCKRQREFSSGSD